MELLALVAVGLLFLAQGIPIYFFTVGLPSILRSEGSALEHIGLFAILAAPWAFKFMWAPYIDRRGTRRAWIISLQIITALSLLAMSFFPPHAGIKFLFAMGIIISFASSSQDIAIDAWAIEKLRPTRRNAVNALQASGAATGSMIGGALVLYLYQNYGWLIALRILAALTFLAMVPAIFVLKMWSSRETNASPTTVTGPSLANAWRNPAIRKLLLLALVFRAGEGLVMGMQQPMLVDLGLPLEQIGILISTVGAIIGLTGAWLAKLLMPLLGAKRSLILYASLRTAIYASFMLCLSAGLTSTTLYSGLVLANLLTRYLAYVPLHTLYMDGSSLRQAGTDFSVIIGADYFFYLTGAALSGFIATKLGYTGLFTLATLISLAGIIPSSRLIQALTPSKTSQQVLLGAT